MRLSLRLYEASLPPRDPWDQEANLAFLLAEGQEAPLVLYAEAYGERAMEEVKWALGLPSTYDGGAAVDIYEEDVEEWEENFLYLVDEAVKKAHLVGEVECALEDSEVQYALKDPEVWERLYALNRDFTLSFARFWEDELTWKKRVIQNDLRIRDIVIEAYERVVSGRVLPERLYPLYWQALEARGVLQVAKEGEGVRLTLPGGLSATLPVKGASPEVVGLLLELGDRVPKRLLASSHLFPHSFRGWELYPYGRLVWDLNRDRPLLMAEIGGGRKHRSFTFPLAQESPYSVSSDRELSSLPPLNRNVRYVLVAFAGREGKTFTKALALPEGEYRLLSPQAQAADPRRYPEVMEAAREEALREYGPRDPLALKEEALKKLEALEGLIEAVASFRERERRKAFSREAPFDAEPDL